MENNFDAQKLGLRAPYIEDGGGKKKNQVKRRKKVYKMQNCPYALPLAYRVS